MPCKQSRLTQRSQRHTRCRKCTTHDWRGWPSDWAGASLVPANAPKRVAWTFDVAISSTAAAAAIAATSVALVLCDYYYSCSNGAWLASKEIQLALRPAMFLHFAAQNLFESHNNVPLNRCNAASNLICIVATEHQSATVDTVMVKLSLE